MSRHPLLPAVAIACCLLGTAPAVWAEPTPPIMPRIEETPLPPPVTLPAVARPAGLTDQPLTATEAALIALQRQPSLAAPTAGVQAAQARVQQAQAGLRPGVLLTGGYSNDIITPGSGGRANGDGFSTGASLKQLLYDYNHTRSLVRQQQQQQAAAQANLTRAQSDLVLQAKQAFYGYVQSERLVKVNEQNLQNSQQHVALAEARLKAGLGLPVDVVRAQTAVANAALNLNLAQNAAAIARITLAQTMGLDPRTPLQVSEDEEPAPASDDLNALVETGLRQRPEILQAQANVQALQYGVDAAKTANAPIFTGTGGWGLRGGGFPPTDNTVTLGVGIQWSAYDAGLTAGKVREAQANVQTAQGQLDTSKLAVTSDVAQAYLNAKTAEQRLATADAGVTNAEEALRLAQGRYGAGLGTFIDVLDAQTALLTAQTSRVNAQTAVSQARAALAHAINADPALQQYTQAQVK